jgi:hypothetical protein
MSESRHEVLFEVLFVMSSFLYMTHQYVVHQFENLNISPPKSYFFR